jgi:hypothetical protein
VPPRETVPADDQEAAGSNGAEHDGTASVPVTGQPWVPTCPPRRRTPLVPAARIHTAARPGGADVPASALLAGRSGWAGRQLMAPNGPRVPLSVWRITFHARIAIVP